MSTILKALFSDAIITIRCADSFWLSELIWRLMARNAAEGVLYLQWSDYHERYWSFDYERFVRVCGADARMALRNVHVLRAFTKDNNDVAANWERIRDVYIRGNEGLDWDDRDYSPSDKSFLWCGAFAAYCYGDLKLPIREKHFASTNRLYNWSEGNERRRPIEDVQPGDVGIVGKEVQSRCRSGPLGPPSSYPPRP